MNKDTGPQYHPHRSAEADAFGELVRDHAAMVRATARRITGDAALAEDVAQETFVAFASRRHTALESVAAWLCRVAGRKAKNAVRGESRRRRNEAAAVALASGDTNDLPWTMLEPAIRQFLKELPTPWMECLEEHYLEGRTQQEIAQRRGVSQATVSRHLDAGIRELKKMVRSKGLMAGTALATVTSAQAASASSLPTTSCSGSIAVSGAHSSSPMSAFSSVVLTMNATKIFIAAAAATALIGIPVFLYHRQADEPVKPAAAKPASKAPAASGFARPGNTKTSGAATAPKLFRPKPVTEEVRRKVDALLQRCGGMSVQEMMKDPEMRKVLENFSRLLDTAEESSSRGEHALTGLLAVKGVKLPDLKTAGDQPESENPPASAARPQGQVSGPQRIDLGLTMNFGSLEEPLGRSMLEASLSNDPKLAQDWMVNLLEGATFEFAMDPTLDRTSEGVTFQKSNAAPKKDTEED